MTKNSIYKSESGKNAIIGFYETIIKNWHKPSKEHFISTNYGNTFIIECGDKSDPVIVLLHGSGSNSAMWMADVGEYSKNYHIYAIDIIGECGKSAETRPVFNSHHYSNWLNEILEKLNIAKVIIIGCSLGGWIALDYAICFPGKIRKLVLLATSGVTHVRIKIVFWILVTSIFGKWGFKKLNKMVYGNLDIDITALDFASLVKEHYNPRTDMLPIFTDESLKSIQTNVFFIGGANDCFYNSYKTASRLAKLLTNFENDVLADTGHVLVNHTKRILNFINE